MRNNNSKLKAFVRFDGSGRIVPSSLILQASMPKVGKWKEINAKECCNTTPNVLRGVQFSVDITIEDGFNNIGRFSVCSVPEPGPDVNVTVDWGDGTIEILPTISEQGCSEPEHTYSIGTYTVIITADLPERIGELGINYND